MVGERIPTMSRGSALNGNSGIFKPGPYVHIFWCANDSRLTKVLEWVRQIVWVLILSKNITETLPTEKNPVVKEYDPSSKTQKHKPRSWRRLVSGELLQEDTDGNISQS